MKPSTTWEAARPPSSERASRTATARPASSRWLAATSPAGPPPITIAVQTLMPSRRTRARPRDSVAPGRSAARRRLGLRHPRERLGGRLPLRGHAERLVVDGRLTAAGLRPLRRDVLLPLHFRRLAHAPASTRAGAPHACRTSGTAADPSSCWPF